MQVEITSFTGTFIILDSSLADTNSVTFSVDLSASSWSAASWRFSLNVSLFWRRSLDVFDFPAPLNLARVSFI